MKRYLLVAATAALLTAAGVALVAQADADDPPSLGAIVPEAASLGQPPVGETIAVNEPQDDGRAGSLPAQEPPEVEASTVDPVAYEDLVAAVLADAPPQPQADLNEHRRLASAFEDRFVVAEEFDESGSPLWYATAWTGYLGENPAVCIGTPLSVGCIDDANFQPIAPVTVKAIGGFPPELVLIAEPKTVVTELSINGRVINVAQVDLRIPSGRTAIALSLPEGASARVVVGYTDASGSDGRYAFDYDFITTAQDVGSLDRDLLLAREYAPTGPEYAELNELSERLASGKSE